MPVVVDSTDGQGNRTAMAVDADGAGSQAAQTTTFVYDGGQAAMEFSGTGGGRTFVYRYLYGLIEGMSSGQVAYLLTPEPATLALVLTGVGILSARRRAKA